jgi:peptidoglycan hydrolase-like protein with peptidoglycan-binding domain
MTTIRQIIDSSANGTCGTISVNKLSMQIIAEMNAMIPNVLVNFGDLNVDISNPAVHPFMQSSAKDALRRAIKAHGKTLKVTSAYRTIAQQYLLYSWNQEGLCDIGRAATPGKSNHEDGLAIDIPNHNEWHDSLENEDWEQLDPNGLDPFHYSYQGGGRDDIGKIGVEAFQRLWNKYNPSDQIDTDGYFGPQTAARMDLSPAEGFPTSRFLRVSNPLIKGDDVRKVQQALVNLKLLTANEITGTYDQKTADKVIAFQKDRGLSQDGIVGPATRRELGIPA